MKNALTMITRVACPTLSLALACTLTTFCQAESPRMAGEDAPGLIGGQPRPAPGPRTLTSAEAPQPAITLDAPTGWELQAHTFSSKGERLPEAPANFRRLGEARSGEAGDVHTLSLRFTETAKLTQIRSTSDFRVEAGGSCAEGNVYQANTACTVLVRFTPQGAGNRLGHLSVSTAGSLTPMAFGLGGYGYAPIISFIPAQIQTIPTSYPASVGLLSGAQNLAIDGGDTLWVSDTNNNVVRNMDSSGNFKTLASGFSAPWGITVDTFGQAYFSRPAANALHEIYDYGPVVQINGAGTGGCPASTPCTLSSHTVTKPGEMSMDPYNHMFFTEQTSGGALSTVQPVPANLIFLYDPFPYQTVTQGPAAMDASDNIYSFWTTSGNCELVQQSLYNAENSNVSFNKIAGGHTCGFTGDGGLANNAEIGTSVGQIAFDTAGDLYFTDTANQRVRRIDYTTGIIRTVAGNGIAGYTGDNGRATTAELSNPTGVAVDSHGAIYIISSAASGQVIRKVGPMGIVVLPSTPKGKSSAAYFVTVNNTGNSTMTLTNLPPLYGNNPSEFKIDTSTTTCVLTAGATLNAGQSCQIGFIFTPAGVGTRSAYLNLLDNSISGTDTVLLVGTGTLPVPTFTITSPANGATFTSGTAVTFSVSVTSTSGPQPTGTVQFKVDGGNYGSPVTLGSTGTASTSVTGLTIATHTLSVTYSGDANYAAAGPISVSSIVSAAKVGPIMSMSTVPLAANSCSAPEFAVKVSGASGPVPTGEVKLIDGSTVLSSGVLTNGQVLLSTLGLSAGSHTLTVSYAGDVYHYAGTLSAAVTVAAPPHACTIHGSSGIKVPTLVGHALPQGAGRDQ